MPTGQWPDKAITPLTTISLTQLPDYASRQNQSSHKFHESR
ncbi:hypothetical protein EMIT0194P_130119 [Pseudomonas serbica]